MVVLVIRQYFNGYLVLFCVQCCVCRKRLSSPRCRSELIDSAWVVIVHGQKCIKCIKKEYIQFLLSLIMVKGGTKRYNKKRGPARRRSVALMSLLKWKRLMVRGKNEVLPHNGDVMGISDDTGKFEIISLYCQYCVNIEVHKKEDLVL